MFVCVNDDEEAEEMQFIKINVYNFNPSDANDGHKEVQSLWFDTLNETPWAMLRQFFV